MTAPIAGMASAKRLVLITGLHLLRAAVRALLAVGVVLSLRTLLRWITPLPIRRRVGVHAFMVSVNGCSVLK